VLAVPFIAFRCPTILVQAVLAIFNMRSCLDRVSARKQRPSLVVPGNPPGLCCRIRPPGWRENRNTDSTHVLRFRRELIQSGCLRSNEMSELNKCGHVN